MNGSYTFKIEGWDADHITNMVVAEIVNSFNIDQFKNEVKNKLVKELKGDIVNGKEVCEAIKTSTDKVDKIIDSRVNQAINDKIKQIQNIDIGNFQLTLK